MQYRGNWRGAGSDEPMRISTLHTWEELANVEGWPELAASCDASPFAWPSFCLPWWYEAGTGQLMAVVVEEADVLVGLAPLHLTKVGGGGQKLRFLGHGSGSFNQFIVADDRSDITTAIWEQLASRAGILISRRYLPSLRIPIVNVRLTPSFSVSIPLCM